MDNTEKIPGILKLVYVIALCVVLMDVLVWRAV
jgi:hypothetical protein